MVSKHVFRTDVLDGDGSAGDAVIVCTAQLDLDLETEAAARRELARLSAGTGPIVVDVSEVFVAVVGFRLLIDCVQELRRTGRRVELVVNRHLQRVAHVLGEQPDVLWSTLPDALIRVRTPTPGTGVARTGADRPIGVLAEWLGREAGDAAVATSLVELLSGLDVPDPVAGQRLLRRVERVLAAAEGVLGVDCVELVLLTWHDRLQHERRRTNGSPVASAEPGVEGLVRSVLSVPVRARGRVLGSLDLVRSRPGAWSEEQRRAGQAYADVIGVLLTLGAPGPSGAESSA